MSEADKIIESLKNSGRKVEEFYTGNKTSDKNVANIEELIKEYKTYNDLDGIQDLQPYIRALQNILADYTRQKQINKEHQKENRRIKRKSKRIRRGFI